MGRTFRVNRTRVLAPGKRGRCEGRHDREERRRHGSRLRNVAANEPRDHRVIVTAFTRRASDACNHRVRRMADRIGRVCSIDSGSGRCACGGARDRALVRQNRSGANCRDQRKGERDAHHSMTIAEYGPDAVCWPRRIGAPSTSAERTASTPTRREVVIVRMISLPARKSGQRALLLVLHARAGKGVCHGRSR